MEVKAREFKIWHDHLEHEARRECAVDHWHGELSEHDIALPRLGVMDEDELRELNELAYAAYESVRDLSDWACEVAGRQGRGIKRRRDFCVTLSDIYRHLSAGVAASARIRWLLIIW